MIEARFPEGTERGLGWALEEKDDQGWHVRYYLTSKSKRLDGQADPSWRPADGGEPGWDAMGRSGEGPDMLMIPDTAAPGEYRLCTANAGKNFCAAVDIVE